MRDGRSSKPEPLKLTNFHIVVSSFAAIAGVTIAGYQTFAPKLESAQQVQVTVALDPLTARDAAAAKQDGGPMLQTSAIALERNARFTAALKDGSDSRYDFTQLFDGDPATSIEIAPPDSELNVLITFNTTSAQPVTALQYTPPSTAGKAGLATSLDVMVLPEGQLEASGRPVISFTLQQSNDSQTFAIPGHAVGKSLWLRVAGSEDGQPIRVGDFSILREQLAP